MAQKPDQEVRRGDRWVRAFLWLILGVIFLSMLVGAFIAPEMHKRFMRQYEKHQKVHVRVHDPLIDSFSH